eukprot:gnl/MRDRNA2_/MRDRNA2_67846_c0_seq1.p1 gnl/MRDRNA2_/MRDRNA2_67846_c0~~gnl/MRDRNA2_/MRDRNA2_67846_c0_seq1.p1  ORF type:complete len:647 (-),score=109.89 gnl/MRDRNA2_/MRDRNA2_67846_c0_seq1:148-2088(-)
MYCSVMIPVDLGLGVLNGTPWETLDLCILIFFSVDIVLNFNTAFYDGYGNLEKTRFQIARRYVASWFILDFLSTFPFDVVLSSMKTKGTTLMRLPRIVKMMRLVRLMRLARVQDMLQRIFGIQMVTNMIVIFFVKFSSLFVALMLICHWLACGFCAIGVWEEDEDMANDLYDGVRKVGWTYDGINAVDMNPTRRYQAAFYFNFCAVLMMKPGDMALNTTYCRYFMMLIGFVKPVVGAAIMGVLTNMIVKNNSKRGALQLKKQALGAFMQEKKVSAHIQHQVLAYLDHGEKQMQTMADIDAIQTLSPTLQDEVAYHTMRAIIHTFALFEAAFGSSFVRQICSSVKLELFGPDDVICQEGHYITRMVFVNTGSVKLFRTVQTSSPKTAPISYQTDGMMAEVHSFGEISAGESFGGQGLLLAEGAYSRFTAICFVFCELVFLTRQNFQSIVSRSPVWEKTLKKAHSALIKATDQDLLLEQFARGDEAGIKDVLDATGYSSRNRRAFFAGTLQRAVEKIKTMNLMNSQRSRTKGEFTVKRPQSTAIDAQDDPIQTSGFQTMKLSAAERCILQELSSLREKFQSSLADVEENMARRADQNSHQLEKRIIALDDKLHNLNNHLSTRIAAVEKAAMGDAGTGVFAKGDTRMPL